MTTNTKAIIKSESFLLDLKSKDRDRWELTKVEVGQSYPPHCGVTRSIYICYHQGLIQWIADSEGVALQRFMNIIPNEIRDKLEED